MSPSLHYNFEVQLVETNKRDKGYIFLLGVQFYQIYDFVLSKKDQVNLKILSKTRR